MEGQRDGAGRGGHGQLAVLADQRGDLGGERRILLTPDPLLVRRGVVNDAVAARRRLRTSGGVAGS
ncbi:hypothetical protein QFZ60_000013 [Arthrobacter sp. B2I5]|nr:hypothetical protein [Arthrobacter sp. B2I5]